MALKLCFQTGTPTNKIAKLSLSEESLFVISIFCMITTLPPYDLNFVYKKVKIKKKSLETAGLRLVLKTFFFFCRYVQGCCTKWSFYRNL